METTQVPPSSADTTAHSEPVSEEILQAMGVSRPAWEEIQAIVGHLPTADELSTLLAMWQTQGRRQGLLSWLRGQPHSLELHDYLTSEHEPQSDNVREPRVKDCIDIAHRLSQQNGIPMPAEPFRSSGDALYMVGDVSLYFGNSDYSRQVLHLADNPLPLEDETECATYISMILDSLRRNDSLFSVQRVARGGLWATLLAGARPRGLGFDILTCREVRLDAFLFGEQGVRYVVSMDEPREDFFLLKLSEARLNCCFLGRTTKGRILVDGTDFGPVADF